MRPIKLLWKVLVVIPAAIVALTSVHTGVNTAAMAVTNVSMGGAQAAAVKTDQSDRFNMSYIYFGDTGAYTRYIDNTCGSLDDISPSYFDLNEDGTLKLTLAVDRSFVDEMHKKGVKVTPFLSNHWNRQIGVNALAKRDLLSTQIVEAIMEYNLDGVNIDIENVTETERDSYTDLVRLIRHKLPGGKSVSVAVAPNPYKITTGWHGSYDYEKLAQYSDYLMFMAYDEHYQGGPAGPVASYTFVENTIKAALKNVPADKLVLGIPFYGRLWKQGSSYGGYGISNNAVESLIANYRGKIVYDKAAHSPKATITILKSDTKPLVFGKALEAGKYDIWFENEESIKSKLALIGKYDLKGTGSWSLGQEGKSTWDYYSLWLNGKYFSDIQTSWAKQSIVSVMDKGWMIGVSASQFMPEACVTRAQAAVILVRALGIDTVAFKLNASTFIDTTKHWARTEIEAARHNGLVEGTGAGKYEPDKVLTREEMAVLLDRALTIDLQSAAAFNDVTAESSPWSYKAINRIAAAGILLGYPDGAFRPRSSITRDQMAALFDRSSSYF